MEIKDVLSLEIKPKEKVDKTTIIVLEEPNRIDELMINFKGCKAVAVNYIDGKGVIKYLN